MDKYQVIVVPAAERQSVDAYDYYLRSSTTHANAIRKINRLSKVISGLSQFPMGFRLVDIEPARSWGMRSLTVQKYTILFVVRKTKVYIIGVVWATSDIDVYLEDFDCRDIK